MKGYHSKKHEVITYHCDTCIFKTSNEGLMKEHIKKEGHYKER